MAACGDEAEVGGPCGGCGVWSELSYAAVPRLLMCVLYFVSRIARSDGVM